MPGEVFANTTVEDISQMAGLGKGTVYLYFRSKEEIFVEVMNAESEKFFKPIRDVLSKDGPFEARLRDYIKTRLNSIDSIVKNYNMSQPVYEETINELNRAGRLFGRVECEILEQMISQGVARKELAFDDTQLVAQAITATLDSLDMPWLFEEKSSDAIERKTETLVRFFLKGLTG
ncbi:MAG: TetR/AcrR family transcriptional regulator [Deltaproteobacteria bacterium]|nr:TetR/AcrR family transcriptional regulator [Deltaproteobacteria bacterium]